jgi:hypothetical protein
MRFSLPALLVATVASSLAAQDPPAAERKRAIGFGVSMSPIAFFIEDEFGLVPAGLGNFLIPIRVSPKVTIEAELGMLRFSTVSDGGGGIPPSEDSFSNTRIGVGILGDMSADGMLKPYLGMRIVRLTTSIESGGFSQSRTGWTIAGVIGGQHFFGPSFSLGGEVQLQRTAFGEPETSGGGGFPIPGEKSTFFGTNGLVTIRWFP